MYEVMKVLLRISWSKFIYYNFFSGKVRREKHTYLIPYRGSVIRIRRGAVLYLKESLYLNFERNIGVYEPCYLRMEKNAVLKIQGKTHINHNCKVVVCQDAVLEIGQMRTNVGCFIICTNSIKVGCGVTVGWNVTIMDGDGHPVGYGQEAMRKSAKPVIIGNHVWLCTGCMIMKGSKIGDGAIIGAGSFITGRVKAGAMTSPMPSKVIMENVNWER